MKESNQNRQEKNVIIYNQKSPAKNYLVPKRAYPYKFTKKVKLRVQDNV